MRDGSQSVLAAGDGHGGGLRVSRHSEPNVTSLLHFWRFILVIKFSFIPFELAILVSLHFITTFWTHELSEPPVCLQPDSLMVVYSGTPVAPCWIVTVTYDQNGYLGCAVVIVQHLKGDQINAEELKLQELQLVVLQVQFRLVTRGKKL